MAGCCHRFRYLPLHAPLLAPSPSVSLSPSPSSPPSPAVKPSGIARRRDWLGCAAVGVFSSSSQCLNVLVAGEGCSATLPTYLRYSRITVACCSQIQSFPCALARVVALGNGSHWELLAPLQTSRRHPDNRHPRRPVLQIECVRFEMWHGERCGMRSKQMNLWE